MNLSVSSGRAAIGEVVVAYGVAPGACDLDDEPPSFAADEESAEVAACVAAALKRNGIRSRVQGIALADAHQAPAGADVVFNLFEGTAHDPHAEVRFARALESASVRFTGSASGALRLALRKDAARKRMAAARVAIPRGAVMVASTDPGPRCDGPWFVKPAAADGSIGIDTASLVTSEAELRARVGWLLRSVNGPCVVEEYLPGVELNVAFFPGPYGAMVASATAIDFSMCAPDVLPIVTYDAKWVPGSPAWDARSVPATDLVPRGVVAAAVAVASRAFRAIGLRGYGRIDLRIDAHGRPRVIDVNPNCDLHPDAGFVRAAACAGVDYPELVARIVAAAHRERIRERPSSRRSRPFDARSAVAQHVGVQAR